MFYCRQFLRKYPTNHVNLQQGFNVIRNILFYEAELLSCFEFCNNTNISVKINMWKGFYVFKHKNIFKYSFNLFICMYNM